MNVFIIGDSIRLNAEKYIVKNINEKIQLSSPSENCESSIKVKANLEFWLSGESPDLIHINCGLHDIRYNPEQKVPVCSNEKYIENLGCVFEQLSKTGARVIWATSTPIDEERHNRVKASRRYLKDVIEYNRSSNELAESFGFDVHDLYSKVLGVNVCNIIRADGVHFNEAGNEIIGKWIAQVINEASCA